MPDMTVRATSTLLLLMALGACGAPGSDSVFTRGNPKLVNTDSIGRPAGTAAVQERPKTYKGLYRRIGEESRFQPCGTAVPFPVEGTSSARYALQERFRWNSVWQGQNMYGVFTAWILHDTVRAGRGAGDSISPGIPRTRFYIVDVDSLRPWNAGDCGGMKVTR